MEYTPDKDALTRKRQELIAMAKDQLGVDMSRHAERLVDSFCRLSPPQDPPMVMETITIDRGGRGGGRTRKPGNVVLNWRKMVRESADFVLTGAGSIAQPWLIPLAALSIFNKIWTHSTIELSKEQASCLFAMWHRCDDSHHINQDKAFEACRELFSVFQWPDLQDAQFSTVLQDLVEIQCIEISDEEVIWLIEWVRKSYT